MCSTYKINDSPVFGRHLIAARNLKKGELILRESPTLIGDRIDAELICFNCARRLTSTTKISACGGCKLALLCRGDCAGTLHVRAECDALRTSGLQPRLFLQHPQVVMPLRCALIKHYDAEKWARISGMETHVEERRGTHIWKFHKENVEDVLAEAGCGEYLVDESMQKICGVLDVNAFDVRPVETATASDASLRGLYLTAALMNHDCTPNVHLSVDEDFEITVHASVDVPENSMILFNYADGLRGTVDRRRHLKEGKYFDCTCRRCGDSTELGTYLSAIICPKCKEGRVLCADPLENDFAATNWNCEKCKAHYKGRLIETLLNSCRELVESPGTLKEAERVLDKLRSSLTSDHYLMFALKQDIIAMLSGEATKWAFSKKIALCEEVLRTLAVIEPGISRHQGIVYYELHNAKLGLANDAYSNKSIDSGEFLKRLEQAEEALKSALSSLLYEPKRSPEGRMAQKAMNELKILRGTMLDIKRIQARQ